MLPARQVVRQGAAGAAERVVLSYDERFLRRKRLICESGASVMVDLAETVSLEDGDALVTDSGQRVAVVAAQEPVMQVRGANLARLAWHIGNRHCPVRLQKAIW